jgi:hypothetical protein
VLRSTAHVASSRPIRLIGSWDSVTVYFHRNATREEAGTSTGLAGDKARGIGLGWDSPLQELLSVSKVWVCQLELTAEVARGVYPRQEDAVRYLRQEMIVVERVVLIVVLHRHTHSLTVVDELWEWDLILHITDLG